MLLSIILIPLLGYCINNFGFLVETCLMQWDICGFINLDGIYVGSSDILEEG